MNLKKAKDSITIKKRFRRYKGERIGIVRKNFCEGFYKKGEVILFTRNKEGSFNIEKPLSIKDIGKERKRGSIITSIGLVTGVPKNYIKNLTISKWEI